MTEKVSCEYVPQNERLAPMSSFPRKGARSIGKVRLVPGYFELALDVWESIKNNPTVQKLIASTALRVDEPTPPKPVSSTTRKKADD